MSQAQVLDRESPLPLYAQVKRRLRSTIMSWPSDSNRFHTEQALCRIYGVGRATIRQAIAELEEEGLLRRRQGSGTIVNRPKIDESFSPLTSFTDQWARSGRSLKVELLRLERMAECPRPFSEMLGIETGSPVVHVERFRLSGSIRIVWDQRFIPVDVAKGMPRQKFAKGSLLDVLSKKVEFDRGESHLEAGLAGEDYAELLELLPQDPVLMRHMRYFAVDGKVVMVGLSVYRADQVRYRLTAPMRGAGTELDAEVRTTGFVPRSGRRNQ
jgi:GntR family transcriptional regulator